MLRIPDHDVVAIRQRLNEVDGDWRWTLTEPGLLGLRHVDSSVT